MSFGYSSRTARVVTLCLTIAAGAAILSWFAFFNGYPILYPDTYSYLLDGINLVQLKWPDNQRPIFYGLSILFLHWEKTLWPIVLAQGLVITHLVWLTLRVNGIKPRAFALLGIISLLAIATPISWYVSYILPDVFLGVVILGMFLLGFCGNRLSRLETVYLFILVTASICFHFTHLLVACSIAAMSLLVWLIKPSVRNVIRPVLLIGTIALAFAAFFSFSAVVYKKIALTPNSPPFLLARVLADGPGKAYLRATCGHKNYALCDYLDQLPATEDQFLWQFLPEATKNTPKLWTNVRDEQMSIVTGSALMFPGWTSWNMLKNTARQLITFDSSLVFMKSGPDGPFSKFPFVAPYYSHSLQAEGFLNNAMLENMNIFHAIVIVGSLLLGAYFVTLCCVSVSFALPFSWQSWL
jgi:hypothetical protein